MKWKLLILLLAATAHLPAAQRDNWGRYDTTKKVTIEGRITKMETIEQYLTICVDVKDEKGKTANWCVEPATFGLASDLRKALKIGARLKVTGSPQMIRPSTPDPGRRVLGTTFIVADGRQFSQP